jgi:hypothetical protein
MLGNLHVRFGGGRTEKEPKGHLAGRLPYPRTRFGRFCVGTVAGLSGGAVPPERARHPAPGHSNGPRPTTERCRSSRFTRAASWNKAIPETLESKRLATSGRFIFRATGAAPGLLNGPRPRPVRFRPPPFIRRVLGNEAIPEIFKTKRLAAFAWNVFRAQTAGTAWPQRHRARGARLTGLRPMAPSGDAGPETKPLRKFRSNRDLWEMAGTDSATTGGGRHAER